MHGSKRDAVSVALTRRPMFAGVTDVWFVANAVISTELFLVFRSSWVILLALIVHAIGVLACLREPRFFDLWRTRAGRCPRVRNRAI